VGRAFPSFDAFERRVRAVVEGIPPRFLEGVEDVVVHRDVKRHPLVDDVVTLGECESSPIQALYDDARDRSVVHLYYGSFADLATRDEAFDWEDELKETVEHEIQHHWEDRAGVSRLIDEDDLFDAHARFDAGLPVPAGWYRAGERLEDDVYAVGDDLFVELRLRRRHFEALKGAVARLHVLGEPFEGRIPADAEPGRPIAFEGEGIATDDGTAGTLHLVPVVRRAPWSTNA
jgi:hypothetical protein